MLEWCSELFTNRKSIITFSTNVSYHVSSNVNVAETFTSFNLYLSET